MPIRNIRTAVVESRHDIRVLAAIAKMLEAQHGELPFSRARLITEVVDAFHDLLRDNGLLTPVDTTEEAAEILADLGFHKMRRRDKNAREYLRQLRIERSGLLGTKMPTVELDQDVLEALRRLKGEA